MYLDPGFGSMLIQLLIATLAGLVAAFGIFRKRIVAFFRRKKGGEAEALTLENDEKEQTIHE
jgi:hypothetical protein